MKCLFLFLSCLRCFAQFPFSGVTWSGASSAYSFNTNTIPGAYIICFADTDATGGVNWTGPTNTSGGRWNDLTGFGNHFYCSNGIPGTAACPYNNKGGATNGWNVDFTGGTHRSMAQAWTLSNQPNAYIVFHDINSDSTSQNLFDSLSGGRNLGPYYNTAAPTAGKNNLYAGSFANLQAFPTGSNWVVIAMMYNGASSWALTNNVNWGSVVVNPNTQANGRMVLGGDNSGVTPFRGRMQALIAIQTSDSNLVRTVAYQVARKYGYTIPP